MPANAATGVAIGGNIAAAFSEAMDPLTITTATFTLMQGATPVTGTVSYAGVTATFNPTGALAPSTTYTATITTGAKDLAGNALAADFVWSFTTGATPDSTAPIVSSTFPLNAATVCRSVGTSLQPSARRWIRFYDHDLRLFTLDARCNARDRHGQLRWRDCNLQSPPFYPRRPSPPIQPTITIGARDLAGNALIAAFVWSFTTGADPRFNRTDCEFHLFPLELRATGVAIGGNIAAAFSEAMDPLTITRPRPLPCMQGCNACHPGTVSYAGVTGNLQPHRGTLAPRTTYTATIYYRGEGPRRQRAGSPALSGHLPPARLWTRPDLPCGPSDPANGCNRSGGQQDSSPWSSVKPMDPLTVTTATINPAARGNAGCWYRVLTMAD